MRVDIDAAERFVLANARLLDRHRLAALLHGAPVSPVLDALRAYRNSDGGFGHALEPDLRSPHSEPSSTLSALEVLTEIDAAGDPMIADAAAWVDTIADPDGGVPFVMQSAGRYPHAPWMVPSAGGSFLTFAIAGALLRTGTGGPWLTRAVGWCWEQLERTGEVHAYRVKFGLEFLDHVPDEGRARAAIELLGAALEDDGTIAVVGGTDNERVTPLAFSDRPERRSRALFTDAQIAADLDRLESEQQDDGGWTFDWLAWSPGQSVESRGAVTVKALATLRANGRL
jgi:hypothetical protein